MPQATLLAHELIQAGVPLKEGILTRGGTGTGTDRKGNSAFPKTRFQGTKRRKPEAAESPAARPRKKSAKQPVLRLEHVYYTYSPGTAYEMNALKDVNLELPKASLWE